MIMKKACFSLFAVLVLAGCATSYSPSTDDNAFGYSDHKISNDKYKIKVQVNQFTAKSMAKTYFYRRSAELCGRKFTILPLKEVYLSINDKSVSVEDILQYLKFEIISLNESEESSNTNNKGVLGGELIQFLFFEGEIQCLK